MGLPSDVGICRSGSRSVTRRVRRNRATGLGPGLNPGCDPGTAGLRLPGHNSYTEGDC
ncbi:MAG: hypothetical protein MZV70_63700 [Desulfobacterales bacterium]|nr:hypothetical protein [Desulfobacterales bacterium]